MPITRKPAVRSALQKQMDKERLSNSQLEALLKSHNLGADEVRNFQERQFIRKADMLTETLRTQGGCLLPTQESRFIRQLVEAPTMLNAMRVEIMPSDKHKIPKIGIGDQVFVGGIENTEVPEADRGVLTASEIELDATELIADIRIPYASMEDNIEGDAFVDTILDRVGAQGAYDLERLAVHGDTTLGTATKLNRLLSRQDGFVKRVTSYVLNGAAAPMSVNVLGAMVKLMPEKYRNDLNNLRFFLAPNNEIDLRLRYAERETSMGDANANGRQLITPLGVPVNRTPSLVAGTAFLADPRNLIFGIRRRITLEVDRDIKTRQFIFVVTCRVAVQIEEELAVVRGYGITG